MTSVAEIGKSLDWDLLLQKACEHTRTEPGRHLLEELSDSALWASTPEVAKRFQDETNEASSLLVKQALWGPLDGLQDPSPMLEMLERGGVLELSGLNVLRKWILAIDSWVHLPRDLILGKYFKHDQLKLINPESLVRSFDRVLTPEGTLSERASPLYGQLLKSVSELKTRIVKQMDELLREYELKGYLQEKFTDVREGRYILPIKISEQSKVDGAIVEFSVSRQTVFLEPRAIEALNSKLRATQAELNEEIFRILKSLCDEIAPRCEELAQSSSILAYWDSVQAKARLALKYGGHVIEISQDRSLSLEETAHPLLWWSLEDESKIVRNTLEIGSDSRVLLITGPNTGGKTVLLKTVGIAGVCARNGFFFPASQISGRSSLKIPFFDSFYVDVGDDQSIQKHLSSFSGHILKLRDALRNLTDLSLVLVDELNTATDPEEGGALARAFIETLLTQSKALLIATTHDPNLKVMGATHKQISVASMQFNEEQYTPTYRIIMGVPGRSRAIDTAQRLGLPDSVIALARSYLSTEHLRFERLFEKMEQDSRALEKAKKEALRSQMDADRLKLDWEEKLKSSISQIVESAKKRIKQVVTIAEDEAKATSRKVGSVIKLHDRQSGNSSKIFQDLASESVQKISQALKEELPEVSSWISEETPIKENLNEVKLEVGSFVRVPKWKSLGKILEMKAHKLKVLPVGSHIKGGVAMTLSLEASEVELLSDLEAIKLGLKSEIKTRTANQAQLSIEGQNLGAFSEEKIDLRGVRLDEAMVQLERYIDQAFRSGRREVTVVHGLGTGAIREGARAMLKKLPYVLEVRDGGSGHGGAGATIVRFQD